MRHYPACVTGRPLNVWLMPSAFAPHRGGVEELTAQLGAELIRRGHSVTVITNRWPLDLPEAETRERLHVERLRFTLPARRPRSIVEHLANRKAALASMRSLSRPDLVHVQCASSQLSFAHRFSREADVPLVITSQGETAMDAGQIYQHNRWLRRTLRSAAADAAALSTCSHWTREHVSAFAPSFADAEVVPNGVRPEDWVASPVPDAPIIAAWGRHVEQKGFDLLLNAFRHVREARPGAQLLLGGDGPAEEALRRGAGGGVTFLGPLDRTGVADLLARSRIAAVPSRVEPFGIVALEAAATGIPLATSNVGGLGEAVINGRTGVSFSPRDVAGIAT
ncbi:MAG: glycogen synthase, partial [Actinomycetota bacterium]|nr:glycogen synthase [Actinomycetota bacterium]